MTTRRQKHETHLACGVWVNCRARNGIVALAQIVEWHCSPTIGLCVCVLKFEDEDFNHDSDRLTNPGRWKEGTRHLYSGALAKVITGVL